MSTSDFILASSSPRRKELLNGLGFSFEVLALGIVELGESTRGSVWKSSEDLATQNALLKARAVKVLRPDAVILGADTVVDLDSRIFGKPHDLDEAKRFLGLLSGRTHRVISGVAIISSVVEKVFYEVTEVRFKSLTDAAIKSYTDRIYVLDKAGAYAAQEGGEEIIEEINGSISNVIGLPMERVTEELGLLGIIPRLREG